MKRSYFFLCYLIFLVLYSNSAFSSDLEDNYLEHNRKTNQKLYVNPNDLLISEAGLFLVGASELISLKKVEFDEYGFYVVAAKNTEIRPKQESMCMNGHPIYHEECGGCANWWCNFRCKCHSPW